MKGKHNRGVAQLASASGLGPEGPVFESQYPDFKKLSDFWQLFLCTRPSGRNNMITSLLCIPGCSFWFTREVVCA